MRRVEHCASACLMWRWGLCGCVDRKCAWSESVRSERVAIRRKGGRTICGRSWGWVCLSECESCRGMVLRKSSHGFASVARVNGFGRCVCCDCEKVVWRFGFINNSFLFFCMSF